MTPLREALESLVEAFDLHEYENIKHEDICRVCRVDYNDHTKRDEEIQAAIAAARSALAAPEEGREVEAGPSPWNAWSRELAEGWQKMRNSVWSWTIEELLGARLIQAGDEAAQHALKVRSAPAIGEGRDEEDEKE